MTSSKERKVFQLYNWILFENESNNRNVKSRSTVSGLFPSAIKLFTQRNVCGYQLRKDVKAHSYFISPIANLTYCHLTSITAVGLESNVTGKVCQLQSLYTPYCIDTVNVEEIPEKANSCRFREQRRGMKSY